MSAPEESARQELPDDAAYHMQGRVLEGKYEVGRMIGRGGMGAVYEGVHTKLGRKIAIKFLLSSMKSTAQMLERFQNEARMAASVGHRNIVDILDLSETPDRIHFIIMEYLDGRDLGVVMRAAKRLSVRLAVDLTVQILSALRAVHERGIIHRDLKPENVIVIREADRGLTVKLLDFGLSRLHDAGGKLSITQTGIVFGTPGYMAPEQARGVRDIDNRVDIYSLGVILYRMLSGTLPFEADDYNNMVIAITTEDPVPLADHGVPLPDGLADVVMKAIRRDPADRFPDATGFFEAIRPFRNWEPGSDRKIPSLPPAQRLLDWKSEAGRKADAAPPQSSTYSLVGRRSDRHLVDVVGPSRVFQVVRAGQDEMEGAYLEKPASRKPADPGNAHEGTHSRVYSIIGKTGVSVDVLGSGRRRPEGLHASAEMRLRSAMKAASDRGGREAMSASPRPPTDAPGSLPAVSPPPVARVPEQVPAEAPAPRGPRTALFIVAAAVAALLIGGAVTLYLRTKSLERAVTAAASLRPAPEVTPAAEEPPGEPVLVTLRLEGLPEDAQVFVDGTLHPERPILVAQGHGARLIRVIAEGFEPWENEVAVYSGTSMRVTLDPVVEDLVLEVADVVKAGRKTRPVEQPPAGEEPAQKAAKIDTQYPGLQ